MFCLGVFNCSRLNKNLLQQKQGSLQIDCDFFGIFTICFILSKVQLNGLKGIMLTALFQYVPVFPFLKSLWQPGYSSANVTCVTF